VVHVERQTASSRTGNGQHDLPALWPAVGRPLSYSRGYQEDEPLHKNRFPGSIHGRHTNLHVTDGRFDEPDASGRGSLGGVGEAPSGMSGSAHVAQRHPPCPNPARLFDLTCRIRPLIASSSVFPGFLLSVERTPVTSRVLWSQNEAAPRAERDPRHLPLHVSCATRERRAGTPGIQTAQLEAERASERASGLRWKPGRPMHRRRLCGDSRAGLDTWRALLVGTDRQMLYRGQR
jgi:hypothetical protein